MAKDDLESKKIWDLFRKTEKREWCCMVAADAIKGGIHFMNFIFPGGECASVRINYCTRCGRKISATDGHR